MVSRSVYERYFRVSMRFWISEIWYLEVSISGIFGYLCVFGYLKYGISKCLLAVLSGIYLRYSNYLKVVTSKYLLAVLSSTYCPVIHYIGIYS